jgi:hypothetical protein
MGKTEDEERVTSCFEVPFCHFTWGTERKKPLITAIFKWGTSQMIINGPLLLQPIIGWSGPGIFAHLLCHPVICRYLPTLSPTVSTNLLPVHLLYCSIYFLHFPSHITVLKVMLPVLSNNPILSHHKTNLTFFLHTKSIFYPHQTCRLQILPFTTVKSF